MEKIVFSQRDACEYLDVSRKTLWKLWTSGELKFFRLGQRKKFHKEDLDSYLDVLRDKEELRHEV